MPVQSLFADPRRLRDSVDSRIGKAVSEEFLLCRIENMREARVDRDGLLIGGKNSYTIHGVSLTISQSDSSGIAQARRAIG